MTRSTIILFRSSISASADSLAKGNTATDPTFAPVLRLTLGLLSSCGIGINLYPRPVVQIRLQLRR